MKLDIELCRSILKKIENEGKVNGLDRFPSIDDQDDHFVFYQIKKMSEAGYVNYDIGGKGGARGDYAYFDVEITYQGHEFLKQMLDDTVWKKAKDIAKRSGVSMTFETLKAILPKAIDALIG